MYKTINPKDSKILIWDNHLLTYIMPIIISKTHLNDNIKLIQDLSINYNHYEGIKRAWYLYTYD